MRIKSLRFYKETSKVVDLQIKDSHNFAVGKDKIIVHNSHLRPRSTYIKGIGSASPGAVEFMQLFDKSSEIITHSNSGDIIQTKEGDTVKKKIRKGAMLALLHINHPDIIEFIKAKSIPNNLTKFNISLAISDKFLNTVKENGKWELWFPNIQHPKYDAEWDGDFDKWVEKYPEERVVYQTIGAKKLWEFILKNSYESNDPGLFFIDNANKYNNIRYYQRTVGINPCLFRDTRINTSKGLIKIIDLLDQGNNLVLADDKVYCYDQKVSNGKTLQTFIIDPDKNGVSTKQSSHVELTQKNAKVYNLITKHGYEIKITENHEFPTPNGIKRLDELNVGDELFLQSKEGLFGDFGTYEQGLILGLIAGDGTISMTDDYEKAFIDLWGDDLDQASYIRNIVVEEISNMKNEHRKYKDYDWFDQTGNVEKKRLGGIKLARWLKEVLGAENIKEEVPECVFRGTKDFVRGYIQGMWFSDGTVCLSGNKKSSTLSLRLNQSNEKLLKDIQLLLGNFGVISSIYSRLPAQYKMMPDGKGGLKEYWCKENFEIRINKCNSIFFNEQIGFFGRKIHMFNERIKEAGLRYRKETFKTTIKSIEYFCNDDVYCLNQPDTHSIICNSISILNCGEILMQSDPGTAYFLGDKFLGDDAALDQWAKDAYHKIELVTKIEHLGDICNLGHLNWVSYYIKQKDGSMGFDYDLLIEDIELLVRALDNLIDISGYPLEGIKNSAMLRRKIGMGVLGYGSLLMMMGLRYGSPDANFITENILSIMSNFAYQSSALLAKEKGSFPLYTDAVLDNGFVVNSGVLTSETLDLIKEHGLRNSSLMTCAPTGSTGIFMGLVSGGLEPVFSREYDRWIIVSHKVDQLEELKDKIYPEFWKGEWEETKDFKFSFDGDEQILVSDCGNFKIDKNRGMVQRKHCEDYGWIWAKSHFPEEKLKQLEKEKVFATAMELSVEEHLGPFKIFSKYIDQAASKCMVSNETMVTLNNKIYYLDELPHNNNEDTFEDITMNTINHNKKNVEVLSVYNNGDKNTIKIHFNDGSSIGGTLDHKIYIRGVGWVKLLDVQIGMIV